MSISDAKMQNNGVLLRDYNIKYNSIVVVKYCTTVDTTRTSYS